MFRALTPGPVKDAAPGLVQGRKQLDLSGGLLVAGGACTLAALALPPLWSVVTAPSLGQELQLIGEHRDVVLMGYWLWALSASLTLPGMLALASALRDFPASGSVRSMPAAHATLAAASGLFVAGSVLWLSDISFGASAAISVADGVRHGGTIPDWFQPVQQWASSLWVVGAPLLGLSLILYGLVIRTGIVLPRWMGWVAIGSGVVAVVSSVVSGGTPPFVIYLLIALPLGVAALLRARAH
jgi:Domain of unknown function (DUF4386)